MNIMKQALHLSSWSSSSSSSPTSSSQRSENSSPTASVDRATSHPTTPSATASGEHPNEDDDDDDNDDEEAYIRRRIDSAWTTVVQEFHDAVVVPWRAFWETVPGPAPNATSTTIITSPTNTTCHPKDQLDTSTFCPPAGNDLLNSFSSPLGALLFSLLVLGSAWIWFTRRRKRLAVDIPVATRQFWSKRHGVAWWTPWRRADSGGNLSSSLLEDESESASAAERQSTSATEEWTDEERFERSIWPSLVQDPSCGYLKLVLPPACRRLVVTSAGPPPPKSDATRKRDPPADGDSHISGHSDQQGSRSSQHVHRTSITTASLEEGPGGLGEAGGSSGGDDDDPARRLQNYWRYFCILLRSLLSFDYTRAGEIVVLLWDSIRQSRQHYRRLMQRADEAAPPASLLLPPSQASQVSNPPPEKPPKESSADLSVDTRSSFQTSTARAATKTVQLDESTHIFRNMDATAEDSFARGVEKKPDAKGDGVFEGGQPHFGVDDENDDDELRQEETKLGRGTNTGEDPDVESLRNLDTGDEDNYQAHFDDDDDDDENDHENLREEEKKESGRTIMGKDLRLRLPSLSRDLTFGVDREHSQGGSVYYEPSAEIVGLGSSDDVEEEVEDCWKQRQSDKSTPRTSSLVPPPSLMKTQISKGVLQSYSSMKAPHSASSTQPGVMSAMEGDSPQRPSISRSTRAEKRPRGRSGDAKLTFSSSTEAALTPASSHRYFFETANSKDSLKRLSWEVPVPDKNGYVLGDDFLLDSTCTPLLVFVNSRSGPQQGHLLITQLRRLLNPIQVWDLADGGPEQVLASFCVLSRLRILVCGGDGTVSWIISALEKLQLKRKWPPIAIMPLGTGNDLARIHGWGGGYNNESLIGILEQIAESYISLLDRWELTIDDAASKKKEVKNFFNYLGVGADAQAALQVHNLRNTRPEWFFSRMVNKAWYGVFGAEDMIKASSVHVRKVIKLFADGIEIPLPVDSQGVILLNIDSYAGGVPLWSHGVKGELPIIQSICSPRRTRSADDFRGRPLRSSALINRVESRDEFDMFLSDEERFERVTACDQPSSCQDGLLDVVSVRGAFHLGQIKVGLGNAQRLCQCREATIIIRSKVAVQVDGEPWRQRQCTLTVRRKGDQAIMLHRSMDDGGVETEMSKLLDWAEDRCLIDSNVHSILMKEFSRRIESKTRQRRVRPKGTIMTQLKKAISSGAMSSIPGAQS